MRDHSSWFPPTEQTNKQRSGLPGICRFGLPIAPYISVGLADPQLLLLADSFAGRDGKPAALMRRL
jgi:hypothetical protein